MRKPDCNACRKLHADEFSRSTFGRCKDCERLRKYKSDLASRRKFIPGDYISDINELLRQEWVILHGKGRHIEVIKHTQLATVLRWLESKSFQKAIRKEGC